MSSSLASSPDLNISGHGRALLALGLPLVGSHLAQFAITLTDTVMIGWYDVQSLAALVLAGTLYFIIFLVGSGFAWAVTPMVASADSAGDDTSVRRVARMGMWLSLIYGVLFTLPMLTAEPILLALGQEPEVAAEAAVYLSIAGFALVPALLTMVLKSFLSGLERTQIVLWVTIGAAVLNAVINYALIFGNFGAPEMGIRGAAVASVASTLASAAGLALYAAVKTAKYDLFRNFHRPDWEAFWNVFRLGWPIGLTSFAEVGLFTVASLMMGWIGTLDLAAHGIALQITSVTFMVHLGLSNAATVRAGTAFGRGDETHLRRGASAAMILSMSFVIVTVACFLLFPAPLISLYLDGEDPYRLQIIALGTVLLAMAALFQVFDSAQVIALGVLRGVQDTTVPMIMATVSYWLIGAPAAYILGFPLGLGGAGIWLGLVIGLAVAGALLNYRFWVHSSRLSGART